MNFYIGYQVKAICSNAYKLLMVVLDDMPSNLKNYHFIIIHKTFSNVRKVFSSFDLFLVSNKQKKLGRCC